MNTPPEAALLLECAAMAVGREGSIRRCDSECRTIDWDRALRMASWHGVVPHVYRALGWLGKDEVDAEIVERFRARYYADALRNVQLAREMVRLAGLLEDRKIPVIALKGPVLAMIAYGDLSMRRSADVDLLIHEADLPAAADLLAEEGYFPRRYVRGAPGGGFFQSSEDEFLRQGASFLVDVHWRLVPRYFSLNFDSKELFGNAVRVELEGRSLSALSPADTMIFLCVHGTKHGWTRLDWICDVARLARTLSGAHWDDVERKADALGCRRMLLLGLVLARDLVHGRPPAGLIASARSDRRIVALAETVRRQLFRAIGKRPSLTQEWIIPLRTIEHLPGRFRYLADRLLTPTVDDWESIPLPRPLYPLYYLLRPFRLIADHGARLLTRVPPAARFDVSEASR